MWKRAAIIAAMLVAACDGPASVVDGPDASAGSGGASGSGGTGGVADSGSDAGSGGASGSAGVSGASGSGGMAGAAGSGGLSGAAGGGGTAGAAGSAGAAGAGGSAGAAGAGGSAGAGGTTACGVTPSSGQSCSGLAADCGPAQNESCCATRCVPGGTFHLGRAACDPDDLVCSTNRACTTGTGKLACDAFQTPAVTATVKAFWLDRFEVTVGRYRKFVAAVVAGWKPAAGSGKHGYLDGGSESGWNGGWTLPAKQSDWDSWLECDATHQTWTQNPGPNEDRPANCMGWKAAYAFCIWDGGFLPTEAEFELAASGGEERVFPWSSPPGDDSFDQSKVCNGGGCTGIGLVGSKPAGDGRWGQADLSGNVAEWTLDRWTDSFPTDPCVDCFVTGSGNGTNGSVLRGGHYGGQARLLTSNWRYARPHYGRFPQEGVRCARAAK